MDNRSVHVLELNGRKNTWEPPAIDERKIAAAAAPGRNVGRYLYIMQIDPYIDSLYIEYDPGQDIEETHRFVFHEGYSWSVEDENYFHDRCVKNDECVCSGEMLSGIFVVYSQKYPQWHLRRYYTKGPRLLDHIYNCIKQNTAKEMLYKAGLDEFAVHIDEIDELDLLAGKPSDLYDGLSMKVLRSLNCPSGAELVRTGEVRSYIKTLNSKFPELFMSKLNDSQCRYLLYLIEGGLTVGETGRLFGSRKAFLSGVWSRNYFIQFLKQERQNENIKKLESIDPLYKDFIKKNKNDLNNPMLQQISSFLLYRREEYDRAIRRSNRKRDQDWQERGDKYYVRYPQTINDFCREAVYMQNCLLAYVEAMIEGDTTILLMRRVEDVNQPFITIEIYQGELMQAYHRFNTDCTFEEADWITGYCRRHGIATGKFKFNTDEDELY